MDITLLGKELNYKLMEYLSIYFGVSFLYILTTVKGEFFMLSILLCTMLLFTLIGKAFDFSYLHNYEHMIIRVNKHIENKVYSKKGLECSYSYIIGIYLSKEYPSLPKRLKLSTKDLLEKLKKEINK